MSAFALHLLRHGAPTTQGLLMGRSDGEPSAAGLAICAAQARDLVFDRIIASDLQRCRRAGRQIAAARGLPLTLDPRWRELDFGDWDGQAPAAIDSAALERFWDDPDLNPPPGGETWSALTARVGVALDDLTPTPTLIVSHGGAIRAALHKLCGFDRRQVWAFDLPYAALVSLSVWPGAKRAAQITRLRT